MNMHPPNNLDDDDDDDDGDNVNNDDIGNKVLQWWHMTKVNKNQFSLVKVITRGEKLW